MNFGLSKYRSGLSAELRCFVCCILLCCTSHTRVARDPLHTTQRYVDAGVRAYAAAKQLFSADPHISFKFYASNEHLNYVNCLVTLLVRGVLNAQKQWVTTEGDNETTT